jgi:hypothetical protein
MLELFWINKVISLIAMKLRILESWTIYSVFHIILSAAFQFRDGQATGNFAKILLQTEDLIEPLYKIKEIMDSRGDED